MISAIEGAFNPSGVVARGMLVLQGDQYIGKTKWFKSLVPMELGVTADGVILRPDDKDSVYQAVSKWLVELGELDGTLAKNDAPQLKAFLTKQSDELRRPYAPLESFYPRRTVFFGSVNETNFLRDPTGNSRFWIIECESINYSHDFDMQQVWAEVLTFYRNGESCFLDAPEMNQLTSHNNNFQEIDPVEERVTAKFDWSSKSRNNEMSPTEVCIAIGIINPTPRDVKSAARACRKLTGTERHKLTGNRQGFNMPPLIISVR
jgi:putative DNA primase/helicase